MAFPFLLSTEKGFYASYRQLVDCFERYISFSVRVLIEFIKINHLIPKKNLITLG